MSLQFSPLHIDESPVLGTVQNGPIDVWMAACGTIFGVSPLDHKDSNHYSARTWFVDPIVIGLTDYHSMISDHSKHHIQESGGHINVHRYFTNDCVALNAAGVPLVCTPGDITLLDYARPFKSVHPDGQCQSFIIPHTAIGYTPSDDPHAIQLPQQSKMGQLIGQEMDAILAQLMSGKKSIGKSDLKRFLGCVEVAMSPDQASESARTYARESMKRAIVAFVEQNLASPELNVSLILKNFGVSRASLYRMFEREDGVRAYINHRRLYRAVIDLAEKPNVRGQIHRVSERWGFTSDASFNRMVRRSFGLAPGSLFQMPIKLAAPSKRTAEIHELMQNAARRPFVTA